MYFSLSGHLFFSFFLYKYVDVRFCIHTAAPISSFARASPPRRDIPLQREVPRKLLCTNTCHQSGSQAPVRVRPLRQYCLKSVDYYYRNFSLIWLCNNCFALLCRTGCIKVALILSSSFSINLRPYIELYVIVAFARFIKLSLTKTRWIAKSVTRNYLTSIRP